MSGSLSSALALATLARMAIVATGLNRDPEMIALLQWLPTLCWVFAGAGLLYLTVARLHRWAAT